MVSAVYKIREHVQLFPSASSPRAAWSTGHGSGIGWEVAESTAGRPWERSSFRTRGGVWEWKIVGTLSKSTDRHFGISRPALPIYWNIHDVYDFTAVENSPDVHQSNDRSVVNMSGQVHQVAPPCHRRIE